MKFNIVPVMVGSVAAIALSLTPLVVVAQAPDVLAQTPASESFPRVFEQLNLTPEQEAQLVEIRQNTRAQLESLLTEDQQQQFRTTLEQGGSFRQAIAP
ncbi:MAG: hypothetical protein HC769_34865 [Cyanobacteria bacterium CRU_2_1]|nr:hypothetical protein [Cyanobacteria bacterium CRU_2_1]